MVYNNKEVYNVVHANLVKDTFKIMFKIHPSRFHQIHSVKISESLSKVFILVYQNIPIDSDDKEYIIDKSKSLLYITGYNKNVYLGDQENIIQFKGEVREIYTFYERFLVLSD